MRNAEQSFFKKEIVIANRFDEKLDRFSGMVIKSESGTPEEEPAGISAVEETLVINLGKKIFNPREKISFSVEYKNKPEDPIASLSVSVSEMVTGLADEPSISDYFAKREEESGVKDAKTNRYTFLPELNGAILQGKVIASPQPADKKDGLKNFTVFLSTADSVANLQYTTTDSNGHFSFSIDPYYEGKEIIMRTREKINGVMELDDKSIVYQPYKPSATDYPQGIKDYLARSLKINQVNRYYSKKSEPDTQLVIGAPRTIPRVYYKEYLKILPSDYFELRDFTEISREILPALKVRKTNDTYVSGYTNLRYNSDSDEEPVIFLDGVSIDDIGQIIELGSSDIRRIETVPAIRYYGGLAFNGILAVVSNDLAINNIRFKNPSVRSKVLSSQPFTKPKAFIPGSFPGNHPDLRQVLLWEPDIVPVNAEKLMIECFASDITGKYKIIMQGITSKGKTLCGSAFITIQ
ncbi:MAG: hypothetical protein E4H43_00335 [Bacteroidia bacterium]|nr:MAG: hypothetical protein E4H43_00335 [Bacteroidia bacterium]